MILHQAHGAFTDFRGKLVRFLHGSIFSGVGASSKPEAVQVRLKEGLERILAEAMKVLREKN